MASTIAETSTTITSWADEEMDHEDDIGELNCLPCEELDLNTFKTQRCEDEPNSHDSKCCGMFHHRFDRRRPPTGYSPEPCVNEFLQFGEVRGDHVICPFGDQCSRCHNIVELLYHPLVFKRRLCMDMLEKESCPRGSLCAFAHSRMEIEAHATVFSAEEEQNPTEDFFMYRYKTQWCPQPGVHDWDACMYAHTKRDMRRTPNAGYSMRRCPDWERALAAEPKEGPATPYDSCCPRGLGCNMAHGVKEVLYHPAVYRMKMCSSANTCRGARRNCCAFAHSMEDLRAPVKMAVQDKQMCTWAVSREQPQFFVPLTFASFKDASQKPVQAMPRTPSPQAYHREIPEENTCASTEQALQQALQTESFRQQSSAYDQCSALLLPNQGEMFMGDQQFNWVGDTSPCNMIQVPQAQGQGQGAPVKWNYFYDAAGNMHMWPDTPQQQSTPMRSCFDSAGNMHVWPDTPQQSSSRMLGPTLEGGMIDLSPNAVQCNMTSPYPNCSSPCDKLRSDSMGSWGSSTAAPSKTSHNSYADSLRSESMGSWASGSRTSGAGRACNGGGAHVVPPRAKVVEANGTSQPKTSILGLFKEKFKPKSNAKSVTHRFD